MDSINPAFEDSSTGLGVLCLTQTTFATPYQIGLDIELSGVFGTYASDADISMENGTVSPSQIALNGRFHTNNASTDFAECTVPSLPTASLPLEKFTPGGDDGPNCVSSSNQQASISQPSISDNNSNEPAAPPASQPTKVRGRKPSQSEDPSKPFACTKCRCHFRRQDHLRRHNLSVHANKMPFEYSDCRKKS